MLANEVRNGIVSVDHQTNPKLLSKLAAKENAIEKEQIFVEVWKHNLFEIRQNLLMKHSKFVQLNNDEYFDSLDKRTLQQRLINANKFKNEISVEEIKINFKKHEITRHFQIWHDSSTIANMVMLCFLSTSFMMRLYFILMLNMKHFHS